MVVSPDELHHYLRTVVVAPLTTGGQPDSWRVSTRFQRRAGVMALDQLRTVDGGRLARRLGALDPAALDAALATRREMFEV